MSFWPTTPEIWYLSSAFGVTTLTLILLGRRLYPVPLSSADRGKSYTVQLVEWERDRVMTLAKGIAGTAASYVAALIPLIFKGEISIHLSGLAVTGTVAGFLGALLLAGDIAATTTAFTRSL